MIMLNAIDQLIRSYALMGLLLYIFAPLAKEIVRGIVVVVWARYVISVSKPKDE